MSDQLGGLSGLEQLYKRDEQERIEREALREVRHALDTTFFPGWGILSEPEAREMRATLKSTESGQRKAGLVLAAIGLGVGGLYVLTRRRAE